MATFMGHEIGPVEVWAGNSLATIAKVGDTRGPVTITYDESAVTTRLNITGNTPRSKVVTGVESKATMSFGEVTIETLGAITGQTPDSGNTRLALKSRVGTDLRASAKVVVFKPIIGQGQVSTDAKEWFVYPAATIMPRFNVENSVEGEGKSFGCEIEGHPVKASEIASGGRITGEGFEEYDVLVLGD